jgi:hypothetical protein
MLVALTEGVASSSAGGWVFPDWENAPGAFAPYPIFEGGIGVPFGFM